MPDISNIKFEFKYEKFTFKFESLMTVRLPEISKVIQNDADMYTKESSQ